MSKPVPALPLLTFHWYEGDGPGFTGVAVNVTKLPGGDGFAEAAMLILTGVAGIVVMVTLLVAILPKLSVTVTA